MKLKLITLNRESFTVEIEPTKTILDLKKKVSEIKNYDENNQKIIYKGKILTDNELIEKFDFKETDTIVVMELKKKAVTTKPEEVKKEVKKEEKIEEKKETKVESTSGTTETVQTPAPIPAQSTSTSSAAESNSQSAPAPTTQTSEQTSWDASGSSFVTGPLYEQAVNNLIEMGFEKDKVALAMRASFNNPDRAAEYLMNGIPEHLLPQPQAQQQPQAQAETQPATQPSTQPATQPAATTTPQGQANPSEGVNLFEAAARAANRSAAPQGQNDLSFLRNDPQFQRFRELIATNPQLIQPLIQQLGQSDPGLLEAIERNPEEFARFLEGELGEGGEGDEAHPTIEITQEENEAIGRLEALGFDRQLALEAYLICDKNEELAANYLFNNQNEQWD